MTTIDDRDREDRQRNDGDPMTTFTAGDMSRQRNAEPTALLNAADTERLHAAATAGAPHSREDGPGPDHGRSPTRSRQAAGGPSVANPPNGWLRQGRSAQGGSTMSDMTAIVVAVVAFAVAAAARLTEETETHSPESEPRHSMSLSDRDSKWRSVARRDDHP